MVDQQLINQIVSYENGTLDNEATIALFQSLVDTGLVGELQGSYQRVAVDLIEQGLVTDTTNTEEK